MIAGIQLNTQQQKAHDQIVSFFNDRKGKLITLGGYAGTGKTTLISHIIETIRAKQMIHVAFCAYTGKAATVLKSKINLAEGDYCGTIHGLIYRPVGKLPNSRMIFERVDHLEYDLIILDEASMVDEVIFKDLAAYGIPIIAAGDHGQLPPINGRFNLMENPDIRLEEIMRQAEDNPIIKLATMARTTGNIPFGVYGPGVKKIQDISALKEYLTKEVMILCAKNKTRVNINNYARDFFGIESQSPVIGEPVICLRNNRLANIYNGNIGKLVSIEEHKNCYKAEIEFDESKYFGTISKRQFGLQYTDMEEGDRGFDIFDWAYCITTHKSQGSEYDDLIIIEERMGMQSDDDWRRWLYTAVTRAKERMLIIKR